MCAQFKDVTSLLQEHGLVAPTFNLLVADNALYDVLAIQPSGQIEVRTDFIGPHYQAAATAKFTRFLSLAAQRQPDLVASPEYSCPWSSIASAIQNNLFPTPGKLWALGAESITPARLDELKAAHPQVDWLHEAYPARPGRFFDPVVYIFTAANPQGASRVVVLVQFKTEAMAGTIERDSLIPGNTFYYFHNQEDLIRLLTIICSESMGFRPENSGAALLHKHAYVVLHPQLNPEPRHGAMSEYRNWLYLRKVSEGQDILTLNWASGFTFTVGDKPPSKYGGSTIYTKASHFDKTDARLEANHRKGLYYVRWEERWADLCLLNFKEHVFHWKMSKAAVEMAVLQSSRTGPRMEELWRWDAAATQWVATQPDDGFTAYCSGYGAPAACNFFVSPPTTAIARERLFALSAGQLKPEAEWYRPQNIPAYIAETDERSKRLTFTHEEIQASRDFRQLHISRYIRLNQILAAPENFHETIQDLRHDWQFQPPDPSSDFRHNLTSRSGQAAGATVIYLGIAPSFEAKNLRDSLIAAWKSEHTRRLVIWYDTSEGLKVADRPLPTCTDENDHPASVTRGFSA